MPTITHEGIIQPFEHRPALAAELLTGQLGIKLPSWHHARVESGDLTDLVPTEYRADRVIVLVEASDPVLGVVLEVQVRKDPQKRFSWPVYLTNLRARLRCPTVLLVVSPGAGTASWAAEPIEVGPGSTVTPLVLGPDRVPVVTDHEQARRSPELALLSALAHGPTHPRRHRVLEALLTALATIATTDHERAAIYHDVVSASLPAAARRYLERLMSSTTYKFQSTFARTHIAHGKAEGKVEGRVESLLAVLATRGIDVPAEAHARITGCEDADQLDTWVRRAVTIEAIRELFYEDDIPGN